MRITEAQHETLQAIEDLISEQGYSPTTRELMFRLNLKSPAPVQKRIDGLLREGVCTMSPGKARTLQVIVPSGAFVKADRVKGDTVQKYQEVKSC